MHGIILGNVVFICINFIGMAIGAPCPPLKFYIPAWIATDAVLALIIP